MASCPGWTIPRAWSPCLFLIDLVKPNWLHSFLKTQCKTDDLTNCHALGLVRIHDKAANRHLWVHPSHGSGV